jgi:hypothetical protein
MTFLPFLKLFQLLLQAALFGVPGQVLDGQVIGHDDPVMLNPLFTVSTMPSSLKPVEQEAALFVRIVEQPADGPSDSRRRTLPVIQDTDGRHKQMGGAI